MLLGLLPVFALLAVIWFHVSTYLKRKQYSHLAQHPLPVKWNWLLGHMPQVGALAKIHGYNSSAIFEGMRRELGTDTFVIFFATRKTFVFSVRIPLIAKVFSNHRAFFKQPTNKQTIAYINGVRVFGDKGILTEPGTEVWYHKRKMMDPAFQKKYLRVLMGDMNRSSKKFCQYLTDIDDQKRINIYDVLCRVALEVVCSCGFNLKDDFITKEASALNQAVLDAFSVIPIASFNFMTFWLPWNYRSEKRSLKEAMGFLRTTMRAHLQDRFDAISDGSDTTSNDILAHIIRGNMFSDKISMDDIVDDFFVFLVAGMETTAITMSILIWLLMKHPEVSRKVVEEVKEVYGDKEELEYDDLNKLVYLEQCIKETLRLHPPVQMASRVNAKEETVDGITLPKDTYTLLPTYAVQHLEDIWPNPSQFDPDRFGPDRKIEPFTFFPFTAGPRICIGKHFAMMEAKIVLSSLYRNFQLYDPYPEETKLEKAYVLTVRPRDGVFVGIVN